MTKNRILLSLPVCVIIALLAAFLFVSPAFAQDEMPPEVVPTEAPAEALPIEAAPAEVVPTEAPAEVLPTEAAPVEELAAEPAAVEEAPATEPSLAEALDEAGVALADSGNTPVSLAENSSSEMANAGDPWFTVDSIPYHFYQEGYVGCGSDPKCFVYSFDSSRPNVYGPIQYALWYMAEESLTPDDKLLHIEADTYNEFVNIDGSLNGVRGLMGLIGMGTTPDEVLIHGMIQIHDFVNGFSLTNLSVLNDYSSTTDGGAIETWNNSGTLTFTDVNIKDTVQDSTGITIDHDSGTVVLNRVNSSDNGYMGARIWNYGTGGVKITNSVFEGNLRNVADGDDIYDCVWDGYSCTSYEPQYNGLFVYSLGPVTLSGVSVSNNRGTGAMIIVPTKTLSVKNSVFDGNNNIDLETPVDGWGDGLWSYAASSNLENIQANQNYQDGIHAEGDVSFIGKHLHTDGNLENGLEVSTCLDWTGDFHCDNKGTGTVTLTTASSSFNGENGVNINAKGAVTVSSVFLSGNQYDGIYVDNTASPSAPAVIITDVDVSGGRDDGGGWYQATDNGINLLIKGAATLKDVTVYDNSLDGIQIISSGTGAVTITNASNMFNETRNNGQFGYFIDTKGPVTITNLDSHDNGYWGGVIHNENAASAAAVTVNLLGTSEYMNGYWGNGLGGLYIESRGVVTVSRVAISDNSGEGLEIYNIPSLPTASGVAVTVSDSSFERNYVDDGVDEEDGLRINSKGLITITNIRASYSDGYGAYLNNMAGTAGVTINATTSKGNEFQWNVLDGLRVLTNGAVTLTNIYASNNYFDDGINPIIGRYGVYIDNDSGTGAVTIKQVGGWGVQDAWAEGNAFSNNYEGGLYIQTRGVVSVAFWQATGNGIDGISIDAQQGSGAVTLTGTSNYWNNLADNGRYGLNVSAKGNITASKIDASRNGSNGASLINNNGAGNVTLTDAYFDWNEVYGLYLSTKGIVSWKNGSVYENYSHGAYIIDTGVGKAVTITNVYASGNGETGIYVESLGAVTMNEVESNNNSANYYEVEYSELWKDNLNDDQVWYFSGTTGDDITVEVSSGRFQPWVYITDPDGDIVPSTSYDEVAGVATLTIDDLAVDGDYQIHIGSNSGWNGFSYEMKLYEGAVEPTTWNTQESAANGIGIYNNNGTGAVSIKNASNRWMGNNSGTGVVIFSSGAITLQGMDLNDSRQGGVTIDNEDINKAGAPGVTLTNINFYNNDQLAANIRTEGPVVITNGDLGGNGDYGYYINNNFPTAISPITMTNVHVNNSESPQTGIYLRSRGAVTLSNVTSNGSSGNDGLNIATAGAVKFTQVSAEGNYSYGAYVVTDSTFTNASSTTGYARFVENSGTGLYVEAGGAISLAKMYAWGNDGYGISLYSTNASGTAPITLTDVTSSNNTSTGLWIDTNGAVTVNTLKVENNTDYGLYIDQTGAPDSSKAITLNLVTASGNGMEGMHVDGKGSITTNTIWAIGNGDSGVVLSNRNTGSTGSVTMLNTLGYKTNVMVLNGESGVFISSNGAVTVNQLESIYNTLDGLDVTNDSTATVKPAVTLNNIITRYNTVGLYVKSTGVVTINTSWSTNNTGDGIAVHTNNNVNILNTASIMNDRSGIWVENSAGKPTLKLTGSAWFGNLRNPVIGDKNLLLGGDWFVVY